MRHLIMGQIITTQNLVAIKVVRHAGQLHCSFFDPHYCDVIMGAVASQITSLTIVYSTVYSDADQRKHQSSASLAFVRGIHRGPVNSPHKWTVTRKMFPFDDVIMACVVTAGQSKSLLNQHGGFWGPVVSFTKGVNSRLAKRPLFSMGL